MKFWRYKSFEIFGFFLKNFFDFVILIFYFLFIIKYNIFSFFYIKFIDISTQINKMVFIV